LVLDCDHMSEATYEAAQRALIASGFAFYAYETHGHRAPDDCRFRAVLPLATPFTAVGQWKAARAAMLERLGMAGYVDIATGDPARLYFTPRCPEGESRDADASWVEGRPLLPCPILAREPPQAALEPRQEVSPAPVDLGAVRERLGAIRRPDWAISLGRVIKGEPPSPPPGARPPGELPRRLAWRDVTCALALVSEGEGLALLEVIRPAWEAEQRATPEDYTPWPYVVDAFERALADVPRIRAERAARDKAQREALMSFGPIAPAPEEALEPPDTVFLPKNQRDFALAIRALWARDIRCIVETNRFYFWNGIHWEHGGKIEVFDYIGRMIDRLEAQAAKEAVASPEIAKAFTAAATRAGSENFMKGVAGILQRLPGIRTSAAEFDRDPNLINMPNGTYDVRTNKIREHRREDMITRCTKFSASHAPATLHQRVVDRALPEQAMRDALQTMVGYMALGHVKEQKMFFAVGPKGSNGKSTLFNTYLSALGSYAILGSKHLITDSNGSEARMARLDLQGRRMVLLAETGANDRLDEAQVKTLTGGEPVQTRAHYGENFSFPATHKIVAYTNHKPRIHGAGNSIWRRIYLVLFNVEIPESEWDRELPEKLLLEGEQVMAWILEGARKWYEKGLVAATDVRAALEEYRDTEDTLTEFIEEHCEVGEGFEVNKAELHRRHCTYRATMQLRAWEPHAFHVAMEERGFKPKRTAKARLYVGIRLKATSTASTIANYTPRRALA
jgi:P4 family phage/plasmid primase-like protien